MDAGDIRVIKYFWLERGDLARMSNWKELEVQLKIEHPEIVDAWQRYVSAEHTLTTLVKALPENDDERERT